MAWRECQRGKRDGEGYKEGDGVRLWREQHIWEEREGSHILTIFYILANIQRIRERWETLVERLTLREGPVWLFISLIGDNRFVMSFAFPNLILSRSILTVPWVELGGECNISCSKSGYSANIVFHTKPFYGGKKHRVTAEIL